MKNQQLWYEHDIYRRYWRTYGQAMDWINRHRTAYWKATVVADHFEYETTRQANADVMPRQSRCRHHRTRRRSTHSNNLSAGTYSDRETSFSRDLSVNRFSGNRAGVEGHNSRRPEDSERFEMQITDEMLDFLEKSEQHREELRAKRDAETQEAAKNHCESGAPQEQLGARRTAEMKALYGRRAALVHGMETAVQLTFHRHCDHHRPKPWPNVALNLEFT